MKKILLASTAIVGGALMASSAAMAGNVVSGDNYSIRLGGIHRFTFGQYSLDQSTGLGRGYSFKQPFSEVWIKASAKADNGLSYGVDIELDARTENSGNADEAWAFVNSDTWGRIEMGEQDGAANRMKIAGHNALKGHLGYFGGLGNFQFSSQGGNFGADASIARNDWYESIVGSGDHTKLIYFTPRFSGFQLGASLTPSQGAGGRTVPLDNSGDVQNLMEGGINYVGKFDNFGVIVAGTYVYSDSTDGGTPTNTRMEDFEYWTLGAQVSFGGFKIAGGYQDHGKTGQAKGTAGDQGKLINVGAGYQSGPWGVSLGYMVGEKDGGAASDPKVSNIVVGGQYAMAPGWTLLADLSFYKHENRTGGNKGGNSGDQDTQVFLLTNQFVF